MIDYDEIAAEALAAYAEVGFPAHLVRRGAATGPEHAPVFGPPVKHEVVLLQTAFNASEHQAGFVQEGDAKYQFSASGLAITPTTADWLEIDGIAWSVVRVMTLAPGGVPITYELHVRKT